MMALSGGSRSNSIHLLRRQILRRSQDFLLCISGRYVGIGTAKITFFGLIVKIRSVEAKEICKV